jgi:HAD superfamily hydrolase (TIGR01490 family)
VKGSIAFFDFDGTITTKDTFLEFIKFYKGSFRFYFGFAVKSPFIVAYKVGILKNFVAKQKVLQFFFNGESLENFKEKCKAFSNQALPALIRPKALIEIEKLKERGARIVVVSASAENWIQDWCTKHNIELLGTRLVSLNGKITGSLDGNNCYGNEKVCRIKEKIELSDYSEIYCYGDSSGDKEMLALATHSFYKPFR